MPAFAAIARCTGCAEPFCGTCLVDVQGQKYCGSCKTMAPKGGSPCCHVATRLCAESKGALIPASVGFVLSSVFTIGMLGFAGVALDIMGMARALKAKKTLDADETLGGSGMALAAVIVGVLGLAMFVLNLMVLAGRHP